MDHDKDSETSTETEQQEPVLRIGMLGIVEQEGMLVGKHRLRFCERDAMLAPIGSSLACVPLKPELAHD